MHYAEMEGEMHVWVGVAGGTGHARVELYGAMLRGGVWGHVGVEMRTGGTEEDV